MDNKKNDQYHADRIQTDIRFIIQHMEGIDEQGLNDSEILLDSMLFRMIQISESAKKTI